MQEGGPERLPLFVEILENRGFVDRAATDGAATDESLFTLPPGQMVIAEDGLYAQCGRDTKVVAELTAVLLQRVFQMPDVLHVAVTLELDG